MQTFSRWIFFASRLRRPMALRGAAAVLGFATVAALASTAPGTAAPQAAPPAAPPAVSPMMAPGHPMEEAVRLISEAARAYASVRDYTCLFIRREQIQGRVQADNLISMKVRTQPFSIYLRWLGPPSLVGQEACYVVGKNNGDMRVHATGFRGAFGFVSVRPDDPRVMQNSRHPITDAGIGRLIERYQQRWEQERQLGRTEVRIAEYDYDHRRCVRVETTHPDMTSGQYYAYRTIMYFDKETHLPIRVESYDGPHPGGPATTQLLESYSYVNLKLNVGLTDDVFQH